MDVIKKIIGTFEETAKYQKIYESLCSACDTNGTMVSQDSLLERDKDIPPYNFFRKGIKEYVFPQQTVSLGEDNSRVIDPTPGYALRQIKHTFNFNQELIKGRIIIEYADSGNRPVLEVFDVLGDSDIPESVRKTLDGIV